MSKSMSEIFALSAMASIGCVVTLGVMLLEKRLEVKGEIQSQS